MTKNHIIGHLDMDAFFASLEERATPRFKNKPLVVGSDPKNGKGRGVVSTANYKAREYGIHSALPISQAWKLSQQAKNSGKEEVIFLPSNFDLYERSSRNILKIIKEFSETVEQGSIDEFYFDLSKYKNYKEAEKVCKKIKEKILAEEKITCSIGIAPNKLISKIAAGINKPNGFLAVKEKDINTFLDPLSIKKIPGIGSKTKEILNINNIVCIKDIRNIQKEQLQKILHIKTGNDIYLKANGIDNSPIVEDREVKSIGGQITFEEDIFNIVSISEKFLTHCEEIFNKFKISKFSSFKKITIIIRLSDFTTISSAKTLKNKFEKTDIKKVKLEALKLLLPFLDKRKNKKSKSIRLIGIRLENFS
ncbi:MAG: DNA polymerase IV [Candidatus Pacebacteria bacterium]|nr:DNA polymerase IV [Candidatus Paceibacterota bacterium]